LDLIVFCPDFKGVIQSFDPFVNEPSGISIRCKCVVFEVEKGSKSSVGTDVQAVNKMFANEFWFF